MHGRLENKENKDLERLTKMEEEIRKKKLEQLKIDIHTFMIVTASELKMTENEIVIWVKENLFISEKH